MKMHSILILLLAGAAAHAADAKADNNIDSKAAFARLKTLVGEWESDSEKGKTRLSYELIGAGTSLIERESSENMPAMMTVFHLDGGRLMLTHYCMVGNQPRMQAKSYNTETGEVQFKFLDATNLASGAGHMHNATIRIVDSNHLSAEWQFYENGRPKGTERSQYTRVR